MRDSNSRHPAPIPRPIATATIPASPATSPAGVGDGPRNAFWLTVLALLGLALGVVLDLALGPVAAPERLLEGAAFGAVIVFVAAAWQAATLRRIGALLGAAVLVAALAIAVSSTVAVLGAALAAALVWVQARRPRA